MPPEHRRRLAHEAGVAHRRVAEHNAVGPGFAQLAKLARASSASGNDGDAELRSSAAHDLRYAFASRRNVEEHHAVRAGARIGRRAPDGVASAALSAVDRTFRRFSVYYLHAWNYLFTEHIYHLSQIFQKFYVSSARRSSGGGA